MHEKMVESCIVCAETESLSSIEVLKTLQDSIDCGLRSLGKDRTVIVTDGHCLLYVWALSQFSHRKFNEFVSGRLSYKKDI